MANETGEIKAMREALEAICNAWDTFINGLEEDMDGHYPGHYLARRADFENKYLQLAKQALSAPPRACDLMSEEALTEVIARGITASIEDHPALNSPDIRKLIDIGSATAIACAYDTKLKATKEVNTNG